jgi:hypothetical protein
VNDYYLVPAARISPAMRERFAARE